MRHIDKIIIHCTATPEGRAVNVSEIDRWHKARGFRGIGYHFVVGLDGEIEPGRPIEEVGAHCKGQNANSIGVVYVGGLDGNMQPRDTRTNSQKLALMRLVKELKTKFPQATVHGHREFAAKACPCFDAAKEYRL